MPPRKRMRTTRTRKGSRRSKFSSSISQEMTANLARAGRAMERRMGPIYPITRTFNLAFQSVSWDNAIVTANSSDGYFQANAVAAGANFGYILVYPALSNMPSGADFTSLFDEYRLVSYTVEIICINTVSNTADSSVFSGQNNSILLHWATDYNGVSGTSSSTTDVFNYLRQYGNYRMVPGLRTDGKAITMHVPAPGVNVSSSAQVAIMKSPWIPTANNGQVHHGCVIGVEFYGAAINQFLVFKCEVRCNWEFRGPI